MAHETSEASADSSTPLADAAPPKAPSALSEPSVVRAPEELAPLPVSRTALAEARGRMRVLFVDDSLSVRKVAEKTLGSLGADVTVAVDGLDALAKLRERTFDVVFTDLEMPRMHGYDLIRELRFIPAYSEMPILVVSSRSAQKHQEQARALGASEYLTKPFTPQTLEAALKRWGPEREMIAAQESRARQDLCLFLDFAPYVLALETSWVERLLLVEEASATAADGSALAGDGPLRGDGVVRVGEIAFAAWDLDALLEVRVPRRAWVLMQVPHGPRAVTVAMRTGPCLFVRELGASVALPAGLFRSRSLAITRAFGTRDVKVAAPLAPVGVKLDPGRLFSSEELDRSEATLAMAGGRRS